MDCLRYIYNYGPRYVVPETEEAEVTYSGTYAKHPVQKERVGSYYQLTEGKAGNF